MKHFGNMLSLFSIQTDCGHGKCNAQCLALSLLKWRWVPVSVRCSDACIHPASIFLTPCRNSELVFYNVSKAGLSIAIVLWDHWTVSSVAKDCSLIASFHPISIFKKYSVSSLLFFPAVGLMLRWWAMSVCEDNQIGHWFVLTISVSRWWSVLISAKPPAWFLFLLTTPLSLFFFSSRVCLLPHAHQI